MASISVAVNCLKCNTPIGKELPIEMMSVHQKTDDDGVPTDSCRDWSPIETFVCKHCGTVMHGKVSLEVEIHHGYTVVEESEQNLQGGCNGCPYKQAGGDCEDRYCPL